MSQGSPLAYEDLAEGAVLDLGSRLVTREEIVAFASEFDPQPMHLDEEAGRASMLGGLAASGWHTAAMFMRLLCDGLLNRALSQGAPGVDEVQWKRPVLAGDTLSARLEITGKRRSKSRPRLGLVSVRGAMVNGRGEEVMTLTTTLMLGARADEGSRP